MNIEEIQKAWDKIKNAPTIYCGCGSNIYTRYNFECKIIENIIKEYAKLLKKNM